MTPADAVPARSDLPLVQRQTAEQPPTSADKAVASSPVQAVPSQPWCSGKSSEPPTSTVAPETAAKKSPLSRRRLQTLRSPEVICRWFNVTPVRMQWQRERQPPASIDRPQAAGDNEGLAAPIGPEVAPSDRDVVHRRFKRFNVRSAEAEVERHLLDQTCRLCSDMRWTFSLSRTSRRQFPIDPLTSASEFWREWRAMKQCPLPGCLRCHCISPWFSE